MSDFINFRKMPSRYILVDGEMRLADNGNWVSFSRYQKLFYEYLDIVLRDLDELDEIRNEMRKLMERNLDAGKSQDAGG